MQLTVEEKSLNLITKVDLSFPRNAELTVCLLFGTYSFKLPNPVNNTSAMTTGQTSPIQQYVCQHWPDIGPMVMADVLLAGKHIEQNYQKVSQDL